MPAALASFSPTSVLPVKLIFRTRRSLHSAGPIRLPEPVMHCKPFSGRPASSNACVNLRAESGVVLAGLSITALPAASAGPTLWSTSRRG